MGDRKRLPLISVLFCVFFSSWVPSSIALSADPLAKPFADAFSSRFAESARVEHPSNVLVVNETVFVSSFLGDAVLQTSLPLNEASTFEVFAHGSYCAKPSLRCGILNGPWGLAYARGLLYVSSFGSDQVLVFEASSGRFLDALGDSDSLDSPEGIAVSRYHSHLVPSKQH